MFLHALPLVFLLANFFRVDAGGFDNPTSDLDQYQNIPALEDLYTATNGQNWTWSSNVSTVHWNFTDIGTNPCIYQWQGLTCRYTQTTNNTITCNIEEIYLSSYNLNGTIPESIGNFPFLTQLELAQNIGLHSTIPYTIGQLRNLSILDLSSNNFTGSIPASLGLLTTLTSINLGNNRLTGPIPLSFGNLTSLEALQLPSNWLSGSIPPTLANLQGSLKALNLYINDLTGPFPNFLCNFTQMEYIGLSVNLITGTLSEEVSKLTNLQELYFDKTLVSGTLPPSLFELSQMLNFDVSHDTFLTGTLPAEVGNWANAQGFYVNTCSFTGTLPASLGNMSQLDYLFTEDNLFTGTLPAALGNLSRVTFFDVYHNLLTGTIPDSYGHLSSVNYLYLGGQLLEGSVPASLFQLSNLLSFQLQNSLFSGSLPSDITALRSLNTFDITSNRFSGPLPVGLGNLPYVQYLFLSNNRLSGQLDTIANSSVQTQLVTIDISNNQFTGSIPVEPFKVVGFQSFAAIVNCMTGEIPAEICQCTSLLFLELDGMCTAQECRNKNYHLLPSQFSSYSLSENQQVTGSIPACLFNMENLIALHLSGNGIQGSITLQTNSNSSIAASLQDLSLSHNLLTGNIPPSLLQRGWAANLDLSYNKLTGILPSDATSGPDSGGLSLEVNRLSGRIPDSFLSAPQISILDGNIFECDDSKANTLPSHDNSAGTYNCGSNSFNQSVYSWIAICGTVAALCVAVYFSASCEHLCSPGVSAFIARNKGLVVQWWAAYNSEVSVSKSLGEFHLVQVTIRRYCVAIAALAIAVLLPVYAALTYFFNSYEYEYAWTVSTAFLSGEPAGIVLFVLFGAIVTVLTARCLRANQVRAGEIVDASDKNKRKSAVESTTTSASPISKETAQVGTQGRARGRTESWATTGATAVDRETLVRASFVSTVHQTVHQTVEQTVHLTAAAVSQSIELVRAQDYAQLRRLLGVLVINTMVVVVVNAAYVYTKLNFAATTIFAEQVLLALFKIFWNEIVVAYMLFYAVRPSSGEHQNHSSGIDSSSGSSDNDHIYIQLSMTLFSVLVVPCLVTLAVSSDCFYNYFVAPDAVAVSYAYVYCQYYHTAIKDGVTVTSCNDNALVTVESSYNPPFLYSYQCSSNLITNYANIYVYMFVIVAFVEPVYQQLFRYTMAASVRNNQKMLIALHKRLLSRLLRPVETNSAAGSGSNDGLEEKQSNAADPSKSNNSSSSGAVEPRRTVFKKDKYIVRVVTYLCLLLTFGVAFPPLAVVITTAVLSYTYLLQVYLGRYMQQQSREAICSDVWGVGWDLFRCVWLVVPLVSCFLSFFVFDTLGDTLGWQRAMVWALVLACLPAFIVLCYFSGKVLTARVLKSKGSNKGSCDGEEQEERKERLTEMMPAVRHVEASTETVSPLSSHSVGLHIEGQSSKVVHTNAHDNV